MNSILISTSRFGSAIPDYFKYLGEEFNNNNFSVVFIFDGKVKNLPPNEKNIKYFTYPNKRPTRLKDFIFICRIIKQEKPVLCISNFGSTNIVTISSYILRVSNRFNYLHTSPHQIKIDSKRINIIDRYLNIRKELILKLNTHLLTNSKKMSDLINSSYAIKKNKISVQPYLLKKSNFECKNFDSRKFSLCIVGRLVLSKGHENLLCAFADSIKMHPKLKLIIAGDGPEKDKLESLSQSLNLKNHVLFSGFIPNKDIGKLFSSCLISISASKSEAFGIVNIESFRSGTPIICTKTEGSKDIIEPNKNGFFVDLTKKNDLSKTISKIIKNWDFFSSNALNTFNKKYSKENISSHAEKIINIITNRNT